MNTFKKIRLYGLSSIVKILASHYLGTTIMKLHYLRLNTEIDVINEKLKDYDFDDVKELQFNDFLFGDKKIFSGGKMDLYKTRCQDPTYHAYGIFEGDKLVYSTWVSTEKLGLPIVKSKFALNDNEGLLEDSYCDTIARGKGYHSRMNLFQIKRLYEMGRPRVITIVLDGNVPAMKVPIKSGFEELGIFYLGTIFGINFCTLNKEKYDCK